VARSGRLAATHFRLGLADEAAHGTIDRMPYAETIGLWFPGWQDLLRSTVDLMQTATGWVGDAALTAVWLLWGGGVAFMLMGSC
jgi:hypothetical protein